MAPKKSYSKKRSTRKKSLANKPRFGKITRNINNTSARTTGMPLCMNVKLRYVDHINVNSAVAGFAHIWRMNSVYDPDYALGGHQPMYFDSFQGIYNDYLVTGAKVTLTFQQTNLNDEPVTIFWRVKTSDTLFPSSSINATMEQCDSTMLQLGYAGAGSATKSVSQYINIAKHAGFKGKLTTANIPFTSGTGGSPSAPEEQVLGIVQVFASNTEGTALRVSLNYNIIIDYYVCFFNRKEQAQS